LDSGPLVLFLYGIVRPDLIGTGKTKSHTENMFLRLRDTIAPAVGHVSLPNVLSEASNHLGSGKQQAVPGAAEALARYILSLSEVYKPSETVVALEEYQKVGLSDAAIILCSPMLIQDRVVVFTQDFDLYNRLCHIGVDCRNIMHWRTPSRG